MRIYPFKGIYPNLPLITSNDSFFDSVSNNFPEYIKTGFFNKSEKDTFYIYRVKSLTGTYLGLIAANDINDYYDNRIIQHENTLAAKEQHLVELTLQRQALIKPVLLAHDYSEKIHSFLLSLTSGEPFLSIHLENRNELHQIWQVTDTINIEAIKKLYKSEIHKAYIADGHHRCHAAHIIRQNQIRNNLEPVSNYILTLYLPFKELRIFDYNRVIMLADFTTPTHFMAKLSDFCKITYLRKVTKPKGKHEICMYIKGKWYTLKWRKKVLKMYLDQPIILDMFLFNEVVLKGILGIKEPRTDQRITFISGTLGAEEIVKTTERAGKAAGFLFFPVSVEDVKILTEKGHTLPPKSTWFEPRVANGIIGMNI